MIIEQYISGLGDADLKRHVQFSHPSSLDNAISLALEFKAFEDSQIVPRKPKSDYISSVCPVVRKEVVNESLHPSNAIVGKLLEGINEIQNSMKAILQSKSDNTGHFSPRFRNQNRRHTQYFHCKNEGHTKRGCPLLEEQTRDKNQTQPIYNKG